jgi:hypothetical protein
MNLAIVDRLSLLREQFGTLWIPVAVLEELRIEENLPGSKAVRAALDDAWLRVGEVKDRKLSQVLQRDLDKGEAEAITLALQMDAKRVLMGEREGRRLAKSLVEVTGVLGVLLQARHSGTLSSLQQAMDMLRERAGFRIGEGLYADLLRESGEDADAI